MLKIYMVVICCLMAKLHGYDASPKCYQYLQSNFFHERTVFEALSLYSIPQSTWPLIYKDLYEDSKKIRGRILERAAGIRPNPLDPVFIPEAANKILLDILYESFSTTMHMYEISNDADIVGMFNFIRSRQSRALSDCLNPK